MQWFSLFNRKQLGDSAEAAAVAYLQQHGLVLLARNYKTAGRGGGEIDAIMREADGTVVFVEVRARTNSQCGGAAASISATKQRRIVYAAQMYLQQYRQMPACRFDVMAYDGDIAQPYIGKKWQWIKAAFDAS